MQYVSKWDLQAYTLSGENKLQHSLVYGRSRPKHAVSEELMALGEDKRPKANWLIELRPHELQHHNDVA